MVGSYLKSPYVVSSNLESNRQMLHAVWTKNNTQEYIVFLAWNVLINVSFVVAFSVSTSTPDTQ